MGILYNNKMLHIKSNIFIISTIIIAILSVYVYYIYSQTTNTIEPLEWVRVLIFGLPAVLITYFLVNAERNGYKPNKYLILIGNSSYSIYLSHILTLNAIGRIWQSFSYDGIIDNIIMVPFLLISSIIVGVLAYKLIEQPLLKFTRRV
jgi:peptidoglycan/LPS O-acetylase OafA/YrhL